MVRYEATYVFKYASYELTSGVERIKMSIGRALWRRDGRGKRRVNVDL